MEKLIELLNEYEDYKEKETEIRNYTRRNVKCDGIERIECLREVDGELFGEDESTAIIICKGYMFIKWLVENDKIDRDKVLISFTMSESDGLGNYYGHGVENYQRILMLLSISSSPIEDLLLYLK